MMTSEKSSKPVTSLTCDQALFASAGKRKNKEFSLSYCHKKICTLDCRLQGTYPAEKL